MFSQWLKKDREHYSREDRLVYCEVHLNSESLSSPTKISNFISRIPTARPPSPLSFRKEKRRSHVFELETLLKVSNSSRFVLLRLISTWLAVLLDVHSDFGVKK